MRRTRSDVAGSRAHESSAPRIRSYHLYFLLALFDVLVIMFSLFLHSKTLEGAGVLIGAASRLDAQLRWLQLSQQRIVELNAPGNELFRAQRPEEYAALHRRLQSAKANLAALFDTVDPEYLDIEDVRAEVQGMTEAAEALFEDFLPMSASSLTVPERKEILLQAGPKMAVMDEQQHKALWILGGLVTQNSEKKNLLMQEHQANLHARAIHQRFFIAAVILILVGGLIFGRRLHASDLALEEQRRLLAEERQERLAAIGELCSSVAHGIRNPLAAICSSVELTLELPNLDPKTTKRLHETLREGEKLGDRVRGLLDVARMNSQVRERVNLNEVVSQSARELKLEIQKRNGTLTLDIPHGPILVEGDRKNLELAIIELLSNAMEHSQCGPKIRVQCNMNGNGSQAFVSVEDDGPGVPEAVQGRIFDLFFTTKKQGTGIGLASVKRIAQIHGGDIELSSAPGGGARFALRLPTIAGTNSAKLHNRNVPVNYDI